MRLLHIEGRGLLDLVEICLFSPSNRCAFDFRHPPFAYPRARHTPGALPKTRPRPCAESFGNLGRERLPPVEGFPHEDYIFVLEHFSALFQAELLPIGRAPLGAVFVPVRCTAVALRCACGHEVRTRPTPSLATFVSASKTVSFLKDNNIFSRYEQEGSTLAHRKPRVAGA